MQLLLFMQLYVLGLQSIELKKKKKNEWLCSIEKKNVYLKKNVHLVKLKIFN